MEHAEPAAEVEVEPQVFELGAVEGGHVDGEPDLPALEEVDQEPRRLDGDGDLRLLGRGAQVGGDEHLGMVDERVVGRRRLGLEDVDRRARDLARRQGLEQGGLVDQAASGAVDDPDARLHLRQLVRADQVPRLGATAGVCRVM